MTGDRQKQVEALFYEALRRPTELRASYLHSACPDDGSVRQEVESMLAAHEQAGPFMETPAAELIASDIASERTFGVGKMVEHFRLQSILGAGGMGVVYLAEDTRLHRQVAIKLLPREFTRDQDRIRRFSQEARTTSALNHPNIVTIHDISESEAGHFIVMELIKGRTLRRIAGPVPVKSLVEWGCQVARALAAAHEAGIVHRDIKSENIMVRDDGYAKVLDFGLARLTPVNLGSEESQHETSPGMVVGTVAYMSPEQARGEPVGSGTDIFSLGIVFYQLATGQHPFPGDSVLSRLNAITSRPVERPSLLNRALPVTLETLILQMLEKDARLRPTAAQVVELLGRVGERVESAPWVLPTVDQDYGTVEPSAATTPLIDTVSPLSKSTDVGRGGTRRIEQVAIVFSTLVVAVLVAYWFYSRYVSGPVVPLSRREHAHWVQVLSIPPGATAVADRDPRLRCVTPCELALLKGSHSIAAFMAGRATVNRTIEIPTAVVTVFTFEPEPESSASGTQSRPLFPLKRVTHTVQFIRQFGTSGDDRTYGLAIAGGNVYVSGSWNGPQSNPSRAGGFFRQYSSQGVEQWTQEFVHGSAGTIVQDVLATVRGPFVTSSGAESYLRQYNAGGMEIWSRQLKQGLVPYDIATSGGMIYLAGEEAKDGWVGSFDPIGHKELWNSKFGTEAFDAASGAAASKSALYVVGFTAGAFPGAKNAGGVDAFLRKYDLYGNVLQTEQFGTPGDDYANAVAVDADAVFIVGTTYGKLGDTSHGGGDIFLRKYDHENKLLWTKQYGTAKLDRGESIILRGGSVYLTGSTEGALAGQTNAGGEDIFIIKCDTDGNVLWTPQLGSSKKDTAARIKVDPSGIYVAGITEGALPGQTNRGGTDAFLLKVMHQGEFVSAGTAKRTGR